MMKFAWILAASLMFAGNALADDDQPKKEEQKGEAKVESSTTSTITILVTDENGKVIEKTTSSQDEKDSTKTVQVQVVDGKQVLEFTGPDGVKRTINIGATIGGDGVSRRVKSFTFKADGQGVLKDAQEVQKEVAKLLKDVDLSANIDPEKIAEQVKSAWVQVRPAAEMATEITGEILMELGEAAVVVVQDGEAAGDQEEPKVRRPFQVRRISAAGAGMPDVMKKLEEITKRLEQIEARLDKIEKPQ